MSASREKKKRQEERLNQTKDPKRMRDKNRAVRRRRALITVVSCLLVLAIAAFAAMGSGMPQRAIAALTVDGVDVSAAEYNFYYFRAYSNIYQSYASYFGWDSSADFTKESWPLSTDMTVGEYIDEQVISEIKLAVAQSEKAKNASLSISETNRKSLEEAFKSYVDVAQDNGFSSTNEFLGQNYGRGVNEGVLRKVLERSYLASAWQENVMDSYTTEQLEETYSQDKTAYDWVSYHSFTIAGAYTGDDAAELGEEELAQAEEATKAEAKGKADEMLSKVTTSEAFKSLADEYVPPAEDDGEDGDTTDTTDTADTTDTTLQEKVYFSSMSSDISEYLFDESRVSGDKTVIESGTNYIVVLFLDRGRNVDRLVSVRHILINSAEDYANATEEQKQAAHDRCAELLEQWKANGENEDAFAALATEYTEDTGSAYNGGLYEDITNENWEPGFAEWSFDPARKPGDTGIADTTYGSHAMYFVGYGEETWAANTRTNMTNTESNTLLESVEVVDHKFAMSLTKSLKNSR